MSTLDDTSPVAVVARAMDELAVKLRGGATETSVQLVTEAVEEVIPAASWVSLTAVSRGRLRTLAATDEAALAADALQYELRSGPCVDAVLEGGHCVVPDITADPRWPVYGPRVHAELGVASMLSFRLNLLEASQTLAALNLYSCQLAGFTEDDVWPGLLLASHAAMAVSAELAETRAGHLQEALVSNREIGVAIGIVMTRHDLSRDQAFNVLRVASQQSNRKLSEIAHEVVETGVLALHRHAPDAQASGT